MSRSTFLGADELAQGPVLDDDFPHDGTIAIFIVAVRNDFLVSFFLAPAGNKLQ